MAEVVAPAGELLAIDEQNRTTWLFADASGTARTLGSYESSHWELSHRTYDSFGQPQAFPVNARTVLLRAQHSNDIEVQTDDDNRLMVLGNDAVYFGTLPQVFQNQVWDEHAQLYPMGGRWYDPYTGRYVQDAGGANGYAFGNSAPDRARVPGASDTDNSHALIRGLVGDENLAGATDSQLFVGTAVASTALVFGGYYGLSAAGLVGAGATGAAVSSSTVALAGKALTYGSFGYSVYHTAVTHEGTGDLLADSISLGIDTFANAASGRVRLGLLAVDGLINLAHGGHRRHRRRGPYGRPRRGA